jgi:O-antigen/teichoic acid export membrane protein
MSAIRKAASASLRWSVLGSVGQAGLSIIVLIVLARYLGPDDFGVMALALGVSHILFVFNELLFRDAIVQRPILDPQHRDMAFFAAVLIGFVFAAASWWGADIVGGWFNEPRLADVFAVVGLGHLFAGWSGVIAGEMTRAIKLRQLAIRNVVARLVGGLIGVAMAVSEFGVWSLVAQDLTMRILLAALLLPHVDRWPSMRFSWRHLKDMLNFGLRGIPGQIFSVSARPIFSLVAGYFLGTTALGYINLAQRVIDNLSFVLISSFNNLLLPLLARRQQDRLAFNRVYGEALRFAGFAVYPIYAGIAASAPWLMVVVFGAQWSASVLVVQILAVAATISFMRTFSNNVFVALGHPGMFTVSNALLIVVLLIGMPVYGYQSAVAAALVFTVANAASQVFAQGVIQRLFGVPFRAQVGPAAIPFIAAVIMAAAVLAVGHVPLGDWAPLPALAIIVPLGVVIYVALVAMLNRSLIPEFFRFLTMGLEHREESRRPG